MKSGRRVAGRAAKRRSGCHCRSRLPQQRLGHAARGEGPSMEKAARAFHFSAAESERGRAGNLARRLDWRPTEQADRGRRAKGDASSPILRPSQRGLQGAPPCIAQCGHDVRAVLLRRPLGWPSQCPSEGAQLHPVKLKGGVKGSVPFTLCWLSTILKSPKAFLRWPSCSPHASRAIV